MTIASGANVEMSYVKETTHGTTPGSPSMKELRATSRNINPAKEILDSEEQRSHRQIQDFRHGFESVGGNLAHELALQDFDEMIAAALATSFSAGNSTGTTTLDIDAIAGEIQRSSGDFTTDGFEAGDYVELTGFAESENNSIRRVTSVSSLSMGLADPDSTLVTESGGGDEECAVKGQKAKIGSTLTTFTIERRFTDIPKYQVFRGVAINQYSLAIQPDSIITATMDMLGMDSDDISDSSLGAPTAAQGSNPFDAFTGEGVEGGSLITILTGLNFSINNQRSVESRLFSKTSPDVFEGIANVSGDMTVYFEDESLFTKFKNETETSLLVKLDDPNGTDFHAIHFPELFIMRLEWILRRMAPLSCRFRFKPNMIQRLQRH